MPTLPCPVTDPSVFWQGSTCYTATSVENAAEGAELSAWASSVPRAQDESGPGGLLYFQTSGSEGRPKWVGLSRAAMLASAQAVNTHLQSTAADRWLIALPLHHVGGFSILARTWLSGASYHRTQVRWQAEHFPALCAAQGITLASLVPTQVYDLVQQQLRPPPLLRVVIVGGGGLSQDLGTQARALGWPILQSYGMTEAASQIATEPLAHLTAGHAFRPERLQILSGWQVSTDTMQRLQVRGPALAAGYALREQTGWQWLPISAETGLLTRDFVRLSTEDGVGYLTMLGRESSFVKVKGELVNLATVQAQVDHLLSHLPAGQHARCVVCPLPDARIETRLVLVVEHRASITKSQLCALLTQQQDTAPRAERLSGICWVDHIPTSDLGKISLPALQRLLQASTSPE